MNRATVTKFLPLMAERFARRRGISPETRVCCDELGPIA
jgi:hypothetical protein